jgi:hypothetical protein
MRVYSELGLSSPDIRVELTSLGDGRDEPKVVMFPVTPLGKETPEIRFPTEFRLDIHKTFEVKFLKPL